MKQYGAVVVFRPGVTKSEIAEALEKLGKLIDPTYYLRGKPPVNEFDREFGGPVWYIP